MNDLQYVKGLSDLRRVLQTLPENIERNIMRGGMRAGAKVLATGAKGYARKRSGRLAKSIRYNTDKRKKSLIVEAYVRAGGRGREGRRLGAFYAHMVEKGTRPHVIKVRPPKRLLALGVPLVHHPGARATPYMRPSLDTNKQAALQAVAAYVRNRLRTKHGLTVPEPEPNGDLSP